MNLSKKGGPIQNRMGTCPYHFKPYSAWGGGADMPPKRQFAQFDPEGVKNERPYFLTFPKCGQRSIKHIK